MILLTVKPGLILGSERNKAEPTFRHFFMSGVGFLLGKIMTINQARKILGNLANNLSDDEIIKEIQVAEILKTLFFKFYTKNKTKKYLD